MRDAQRELNAELYEAASRGDIGGIRAALAAGAEINCSVGSYFPLDIAASNGELEACIYLIQAGADVDTARVDSSIGYININFIKGFALFKALRNKQIEVARFLISNNISFEALLAHGDDGLIELAKEIKKELCVDDVA